MKNSYLCLTQKKCFYTSSLIFPREVSVGFVVFLFLLSLNDLRGQADTSSIEKVAAIKVESNASKNTVYRTHILEHGLIGAAGATLTYFGIRKQNRRNDISVERVFALNRTQVNSFDRGAINQDLSKLSISKRRSDIYMVSSIGLVSALGLDKRVQKEWKGVLALYFESLGVSSTAQAWTAISTDRFRPITYMTGVDTSLRVDRRNYNSFYSGHTSATATASFFAAKVYSDMHPELGRKKWLVFAAATIPPALVGINRIKAGKHFYSDVILGGVLGATAGVLIPHLHKNKNRTITYSPQISSGYVGLNLLYKIGQ